MLDVVIRGGEVVDGTGAPRQRADIGIIDGQIVAVGDVDDSARRIVRADGRVVAPGFIDVHTHLDAQAFWDPTLSPSPLHGVTSVFAGNCGFTVAPLTQDAAGYLMPMLARVEGMPIESLSEGVPWDWSSTAEYLDRLDAGLSINAGFMVGHSAIRRVVMGEAANEREAREEEMAEMVKLLRDGLAAGGIGFSSTWSPTHNDAQGRPVPSRFATAEELLTLAAVCREFPGTSLEFLPPGSGAGFDDPVLDLMTGMSRAAQRQLNWNLLRVEQDILSMVEGQLLAGRWAAEREGQVVALFYPEPLEIHLSFATGVVLEIIRGWEDTMHLPHQEKLQRLQRPAVRRQLADAARADGRLRKFIQWPDQRITGTFSPGTKQYEGRLVREIAAEQDKDAFDALLDIVVADQLRTTFTYDQPPEPDEIWERRAEVARDPYVVVGGSDAGAHLDLQATHGYPTDLLRNLVREHPVLGLEEAVGMLSAVPAGLYGLRNRGIIAERMAADLVVFDPDTVGATPASISHDLPGGAGRFRKEANGVEQVLVNGEVIVENGQFTDARPGRVLRSGRDTGPANRVGSSKLPAGRTISPSPG
jgi:N-acyl-D-aspartate/D-glutamate deacylase